MSDAQPAGLLRYIRMWWVLLLVILLVPLIVYGAFFQAYSSRLVQLWVADVTSFAKPLELRGATYILSPKNGGAVYVHGMLDYSFYQKHSLVLMELVKGKGHTDSIGVDPATHTSTVFYDDRPLASSLQWKEKLSMSPDGTSLAFTELQPPEEGSIAPRASVVIVNLAGTHSSTDAYAALFVDNSTILLFSANKVTVHDTVQNEDVGTFALPLSSNAFELAQSADRSVFAFRERTGSEISVYRLTTMQPVFVSPVGTTTAGGGTLALSKNALYVTSPSTNGGATLTRYPLTNLTSGTTVLSFTPTISIANVIPSP